MQTKPVDSSILPSPIEEHEDSAPPPPPLESSKNPIEHLSDVGTAADVVQELPDSVTGGLARQGLDFADVSSRNEAVRRKLEHLPPAQAQRVICELDKMGKLDDLCKSMGPEERERFLSLLADKGLFERTPGKGQPGAYNVRSPDIYSPSQKLRVPAPLKQLADDAKFEAAAAFRGDYAAWSSNVKTQAAGPIAVEQPGARQDPGRTAEEQARLRGGAMPNLGQVLSSPAVLFERGADTAVAATDLKDRIVGLSDGDSVKYKALGASFEVERHDFDDYRMTLRFEKEQSIGGKVEIHAGIFDAELGAKGSISEAAEVEFKAKDPAETHQLMVAMKQIASTDAKERRAAAAFLKQHVHVAKVEVTRGESAEAGIGLFGAKAEVEFAKKNGFAKGVTQHGKLDEAISEDEGKWAVTAFGMKVTGEDFKRETKLEKLTDAHGKVSYEVKLKVIATRADGVSHESKTVFHVEPENLAKLKAALASKDDAALRALAHDGHGKTTTTTSKTMSLGIYQQKRVFDRERTKL